MRKQRLSESSDMGIYNQMLQGKDAQLTSYHSVVEQIQL